VRHIHDRVQSILQEEFEAAKSYQATAKDWLSSAWRGFMSPAQVGRTHSALLLLLRLPQPPAP
jgi:2-oxoglutarate dehydrogenase E1 component